MRAIVANNKQNFPASCVLMVALRRITGQLHPILELCNQVAAVCFSRHDHCDRTIQLIMTQEF